jgi:hypothetical protein
MVEAVEQLGRRFPEELPPESVAELSGPFIQAEKKALAEKEKAMDEVASIIAAAHERVDQWPIREGFVAIKRGLRSTYRQGRAAYEAARRRPATTNLHEWRKLVKYLWYQVTVLNNTSPRVATTLDRKIRRLANCLSDSHDLAMLSQILRTRRRAQQDIAQQHIERGLAVTERGRRKVRDKSLLLGPRIYRRKPCAWVSRVVRRWKHPLVPAMASFGSLTSEGQHPDL